VIAIAILQASIACAQEESPLGVWVEGCTESEWSSLEAIIATMRIELRGADSAIEVTAAASADERPLLRIRVDDCAGHTVVIEMIERDGRVAARPITLGDVEGTSRTRTLVLASVDFLGELAAQPSLVPRVAPIETPSAEAPAIAAPHAASLAIAIDETGMLGPLRAYTGVRASFGWQIGRLALHAGASAQYSRARDSLGSVDLFAIAGLLAIDLTAAVDVFDIGAVLDMRAGVAIGAPSGEPGVIVSPGAAPILDLSLCARARWNASPDLFALVDLGAGYVLAGLDGRSDGRALIAYTGAFLEARLGAGARF
jgi:hypothetical protein